MDVDVQTGMQASKTVSVQSLGFLCPPAGARCRSRVLAGHLINLGGQARLAALRTTPVKTGPGGASTRSTPQPIQSQRHVDAVRSPQQCDHRRSATAGCPTTTCNDVGYCPLKRLSQMAGSQGHVATHGSNARQSQGETTSLLSKV